MDLLNIERFLSNGNGYGSGYGYGNGNGNGYGYGSGYGYGNENGNGYGSGNGDGSGYGYGIKSINGMAVYNVDDVLTVVTHIHANVAKGFILERNVRLVPCYIVKGNGYFAHGKTLREAQSALEEKIMDDMDIDEKIELFKQKFPDTNIKYPAKDFYEWHHNLTGSCEMGRRTFANSHGIDIDNDMMTVTEFIELTKGSYCGEIIVRLSESYRKNN